MITKLIVVMIGVALLVLGVKTDNILIQMAGGFIIGFWTTHSN